MGKSKAAAALRRLGLPMHDSDAEVHRLLSADSAAMSAVAAAFPGVVRGGAVDRGELGRRVFADPAALRRLEAILHPLVRRAQRRFLARAAAARRPLVVLDIPLLFETGAQRNCDAIVAMTAPRFVQLARLRRRPGMTAQRLAGVEARQTPDLEKRRRADFVVPTGLNRRTSLRALTRIVRVLRRTGRGCRDA